MKIQRKRKNISDILQERMTPDMMMQDMFQSGDLLSESQVNIDRKLGIFERQDEELMIKANEFNGLSIPTKGKPMVKYSNQDLKMIQESKDSFSSFITEMYPDLNSPKNKVIR